MTKKEYELRLIIKALLTTIVLDSVKMRLPAIGLDEIEEIKNTAWSLFKEDSAND